MFTSEFSVLEREGFLILFTVVRTSVILDVDFFQSLDMAQLNAV